MKPAPEGSHASLPGPRLLRIALACRAGKSSGNVPAQSPTQFGLIARLGENQTSMKRGTEIPFLLIVALGVLVGGCVVAESKAKRAPTVMIAVNIAGGGRPSPEQAAQVQRSLANRMAEAGLQFARSADQADYILTATLTLDPVDPKQGRLNISRLEPVRSPRSSSDSIPSEVKEAQEKIRQLESWSFSQSVPSQLNDR
jgi:hypothetical protein